MIAAALLAVAAMVSPVAYADTVASLLGNFTINQFSALSMTDGAVDVHRVIVFGQLPALRELHAADADGDGVTTQAERDAYATKLARTLADSLELTVDGARVPLQFVRAATSLPVEQGGFSLRLDLDFSAPLPATARRCTASPSPTETTTAASAGTRSSSCRHRRGVCSTPTPSPTR